MTAFELATFVLAAYVAAAVILGAAQLDRGSSTTGLEGTGVGMMGLSTYRDEPPAFFRPEVIRVSLWLVLALWLLRLLARLLVWVIRTPAAMVTITLGTGLRPWLAALRRFRSALAAFVVGLVVWRLRWPVTFEAQVRLRVRTWWRAGFVYRRQWATAMDTTGLLVERRHTDYIPPLLGVGRPDGGSGAVRMLPGQRSRTTPRWLTGSRRPSAPGLPGPVGPKRRHLVELWFLVNDPLEAVVAPFEAA